ncbi:hypothetical protein [Microbacterium sp.]|uniref:hypothetical protein n=1 Tax=Microbacterium sp. TaxID=51671 RepID=UPI0027374490|nr:hypothetical protein [Microbacterium sp.]MDP3952016.1 hypothetical protein [Microbacterium sp.]
MRRAIDSSSIACLQELATSELKAYSGTSGVVDGRCPYQHPCDERAFELPKLRESRVVRRILQEALFPQAQRLLAFENCFMHPNAWVRAMPPEASPYSVAPAAHQDFVEIQGSMECLTFWAPLFEVDASSGVLHVYRRPDPPRVLPMRLTDDSSNGWEVEPSFLVDEQAPRLSPGDVLCFDALTPHGNAVNSSPYWRVSIEARVQRMSESLAQSCLEPYSSMGNTSSVPKPGPKPPVREFDRTWENWREVEALRQGERGDHWARRALEIVSEQSSRGDARVQASSILRWWRQQTDWEER